MLQVHILVVDDSRAMRETVVRAIASRDSFIAQEASDGAKGLEMALENKPDLILLDWEMPRLDGFEVLEALRAQQAEIPVILMTSHGSEAIAVEFFRKGVKDYLIKPFTTKEMFAAIDRALTEVRLRQEKEDLTRNLSAANQELRRRVRELDILYRIGKAVTSLLPRDQLLKRILDAVFYLIGAEEAAVVLVDEESKRLRMELHRQRVEGTVHQEARDGLRGFAVEAARRGDVVASGAMLAVPLKIGDRIIGVLMAGNCVSNRPFSEHDQQLLLALADYAAIALENVRLYEDVRQADRAKSEFVSFVAHELRTPMTSIRGYADMLLKDMSGPLSDEQEQFVRTICSNANRMRILVSDLQDISRIETSQLRLDREPTSLMSALNDALKVTRGQIKARAQQLLVEVPEHLPLVWADPARLTQILINLLSNAYKYTPEGGHIHVQARLREGYVRCTVSDDGIGISPEDQACLFTKFFRSEAPEVQKVPGTGLGLCIVRSLVELHGGEIEVESRLGEGTSFSFTVPVSAEDER